MRVSIASEHTRGPEERARRANEGVDGAMATYARESGAAAQARGPEEQTGAAAAASRHVRGAGNLAGDSRATGEKAREVSEQACAVLATSGQARGAGERAGGATERARGRAGAGRKDRSGTSRSTHHLKPCECLRTWYGSDALTIEGLRGFSFSVNGAAPETASEVVLWDDALDVRCGSERVKISRGAIGSLPARVRSNVEDLCGWAAKRRGERVCVH